MNHLANPPRRRNFKGFGLAASLAFTAALSACAQEAPPAEPPLAGASIGGEFELIDKNGETVRWGDFAGKYRIVYFGYAFCPDVCPVDVSQIVRGLAKLKENEPAKRAKIQPIFITVDPERDTPEVVGEFTAAFSDDLIGLTGTPEQIAAAVDAFAVYAAKGEDIGNGQYLMDHSDIAFLFGPGGQPLATLPTKEGPEAVAADIDKWVN